MQKQNLTYGQTAFTQHADRGGNIIREKDYINNVQYDYTYDTTGRLVRMNVNGTEYTYAYLNGMLMYETRGESKFYYSYDANGTLYSVKYTLTDSSELMTYYYTHNSRGDIVGLYNGNGDLKAHYEYDAWGNVLSITDANGDVVTSETHIGIMNPFRYRGYYLDTETGLYYLMSRYYDPVTHRFVNADGYFQSGGNILDANMSAYCANSPINRADPSGCCYWAAGQWTHDAWENIGGYKKKPAPVRSDLSSASDLNVSTDSQYSYNCYGNAIGKQSRSNPSGYSTGDSTEKTFNAVYKVAIKCGPIDYHFIRQDENGWYNKSGLLQGLYIDQSVVESDIWYCQYMENGTPQVNQNIYYDDETIYFAIKTEWDKN